MTLNLPMPSDLAGEAGLDADRVQRFLQDTLHGGDDGELFLERSRTESFLFDDGRLKTAKLGSERGFGLRLVAGERAGFAHSSNISMDALERAGATVRGALRGYEGSFADPPPGSNLRPFPDADPAVETHIGEKADLLSHLDTFARSLDPRVCQVSIALAGERREVEIWRADAQPVRDPRPLVRLNVSVVVTDGTRTEQGSTGRGWRGSYGELLTRETGETMAREALRQALVNLEAVDAPAGEFPVVLGPGWPGVLLHEAVGHGLEGDFNRKGQSVYAGQVGELVAAKGVTVVDDGTIADRRGSLAFDDEGQPSRRNVLIEDGVLKGFMQDRMNARLMGVPATGNGRRESYAHTIMPRMTNTFMLEGNHTLDEMIESVSDGIYAVDFGGGQVDIVNGDFVFRCTEAYRIRDGKVAEPVRGATLIGNGPNVLTKISMIGNDLKLDPGIGTCGKNGQGVPVGVGQPSLKVDAITVGGAGS